MTLCTTESAFYKYLFYRYLTVTVTCCDIFGIMVALFPLILGRLGQNLAERGDKSDEAEGIQK